MYFQLGTKSMQDKITEIIIIRSLFSFIGPQITHRTEGLYQIPIQYLIIIFETINLNNYVQRIHNIVIFVMF